MKIGDLALFKLSWNSTSDCLGVGSVLAWDGDDVKVAFILDPKGWPWRWINKEYLEVISENR